MTTGARGLMAAADKIEARIVEAEKLRAALEEIAKLAREWADQPTDYDEDTEQQIEDGRAIAEIIARAGL